MAKPVENRQTDMSDVAIEYKEPMIWAAATMDLPSMPYKPSQIIGGNPIPKAITTYQPDPNSVLRTGIWECGPGAATYQQDPTEVSMFAFFSGKCFIRFRDGREPLECKAGDVIWLPQGQLSIFDVEETVKTFYCIYA